MCVFHLNSENFKPVCKCWSVQTPPQAVQACRTVASQRVLVCADAGTEIVVPFLQDLIPAFEVKAHACALCMQAQKNPLQKFTFAADTQSN